MLVHLAPAPLARRIERLGLRGGPRRFQVDGETVEVERAVFASPHLGDFWHTHQWLRELRRWHREELVAVDFRLGSDAPVLFGPDWRAHVRCTLGEAIGRARAAPLGAEIVIPRDVAAGELVRVRRVRQDVGWIEKPPPHTPRGCVCRMCLPAGMPDLRRRLRAHWRHGVRLLRAAGSDEATLDALARMSDAIERLRDDVPDVRPLLPLTDHASPRVRSSVARMLGMARTPPARAGLLEMFDRGPTADVLDALVRVIGVDALDRLVAAREDAPLHACFVEWLPWMLAGERGQAIFERYAADDAFGLGAAAREGLERIRR